MLVLVRTGYVSFGKYRSDYVRLDDFMSGYVRLGQVRTC
jgi:hypothetical protein